jgi:hypothetical protein
VASQPGGLVFEGGEEMSERVVKARHALVLEGPSDVIHVDAEEGQLSADAKRLAT